LERVGRIRIIEFFSAVTSPTLPKIAWEAFTVGYNKS